MIAFSPASPSILVAVTWFRGSYNLAAIGVLISQFLSLGTMPLAALVFQKIYPLTGGYDENCHHHEIDDFSEQISHAMSDCKILSNFTQQISPKTPYIGIFIFNAIIIAPCLLGILTNEIISKKSKNGRKISISSNFPKILKFFRFLSILALILAAVLGILAVGKFFRNVDWKMIVFAVLSPVLNFGMGIFGGILVYFLVEILSDCGNDRKSSSDKYVVDVDSDQDAHQDDHIDDLTPQKIITSAALLASLHNPRIVQAMIEITFKDHPHIVQEMYILPVLCVIFEVFWAVVVGKIGFYFYDRYRTHRQA